MHDRKCNRMEQSALQVLILFSFAVFAMNKESFHILIAALRTVYKLFVVVRIYIARILGTGLILWESRKSEPMMFFRRLKRLRERKLVWLKKKKNVIFLVT